MNTPNKLTIARICAVPVIMAILLLETLWEGGSLFTRTAAGVLFIAAAVTDTVDGKMARKYNLVTDFGKFLDPLADKMLVLSLLICFVRLDMMFLGAWMTAIILLREFTVTSLRLVANNADGNVIAASIWGKLKTVTQMIAIGTYLFQDVVGKIIGVSLRVWQISLADAIMLVAVVLTILSGLDYLKKYAKYIDPRK